MNICTCIYVEMQPLFSLLDYIGKETQGEIYESAKVGVNNIDICL